MRKDITRSAITIVAATIVLGLIYPAVMVARRPGRLLEPGQRQPDHPRREDRRIEARRTGVQRPALLPRAAVGRPAYNADGTSFSNLGPNSNALRALVKTRIAKIMALEGPYNPGLQVSDIPVDAVTASGSGIDPEISKAYAYLQAPRIAAVRHLSLAAVRQLINSHVDGRFLGFLGEPGVNVLELNLALDQEH